MRLLMYSWEFPPKSVGGLARHVHDLSLALVREGHEVHLITCGGQKLPAFDNLQGVQIHRVSPYSLTAPDFKTWILHLNLAMLEYTITLLNNLDGEIDLVHNHDWLTAYAARAVKHACNVPLVATIHATEYGRNHGLHNDEQRYISDVEWWLTYEAWKVIVCSSYMEEELCRVFQLPKDKLRVIPNGVEPAEFIVKEVQPDFKSSYAHSDEKIVFFVGRLVQEKGVQVLLAAIPKVLRYHPRTKFIIAGKGPNEHYLKSRAKELGVEQSAYFTGYIDDATRNQLYKCADVAVFPSLYEPFGIVALEAMAARTPVVVSDTGGLSEIINHELNGLKYYTGSANSLADNILHILCDPVFAKSIEDQAYADVREIYNWSLIARQTGELYQEVLSLYRESIWKRPALASSWDYGYFAALPGAEQPGDQERPVNQQRQYQ
ncbi:MAG: glycosyltransferase family 4 protein [Carboxydocellales bacterium]